MTAETDVIVVGAGAAGLAAGAALAEAGVDCRVLEAKDRIGGRAYTETETFGVPFDHGCHWLHSASVNPLREAADRLGMCYNDSGIEPRAVYMRKRWMSEEEVRSLDAILRDSFERTSRSAGMVQDVSAISLFDETDQWWPVVRHWLEIMSSGEPEDMSAKDMARYHDTEENWPVALGYGELVRRVGAHVPVSLETPVTRISKTAHGVRAETPKGSVSATSIIVTCSTSVLASGAITFDPGMPHDFLDAIHNVPLGQAEKIAIGFDRDPFALNGTKYTLHVDSIGTAQFPLTFMLNPFGYPLSVSFIGGAEVPYLKKQGDAAMIAFATDALVDMYGYAIRHRITHGMVTDWGGDPHVLGAYSYAKAGQAAARDVLTVPFDDRIFLAGEAISSQFFSTAHGAHLTGRRAAGQAIASAKRQTRLSAGAR